LAQYLRAPTKKDIPYPYLYYPTTQVLERHFPGVVLDDTILVRRLIDLSTEGFKIPRPIHIQVFSYALPLEGVATGVTRVANICALQYHFYFLHV
jgi:hypothetical protein